MSYIKKPKQLVCLVVSYYSWHLKISHNLINTNKVPRLGNSRSEIAKPRIQLRRKHPIFAAHFAIISCSISIRQAANVHN